MNYLLPSLLFLGLAFSCEDDDDCLGCDLACDGRPIIIVDEVTTPSDRFSLVDIALEDRCLTVEIGASGCTDSGWTLDLKTDGRIAESLPTQSRARLSFDDAVEEDQPTCAAFFTRTYHFDLEPYLPEGGQPSLLTIEGADTTLLVD